MSYSVRLSLHFLANSGRPENYLAHRFDLLGSGWLEVRHGMSCSEDSPGTNIQPIAAVEADGAGAMALTEPGSTSPISPRVSGFGSLIRQPYVPIDWQLDFKSGYRWSAELTHFADPRYGEPSLGADVKSPLGAGADAASAAARPSLCRRKRRRIRLSVPARFMPRRFWQSGA